MQTDDLHAEFAPMANNRESVHDLNDNVPVVEIMATKRTKMLAEAAISSAASTSAATRVKKAHSTPNGKLRLSRLFTCRSTRTFKFASSSSS
jgi:hypothetical protein